MNKNNIIFNDRMRRLIRDLERVNNNLGYYVLNQEDKWVKIEQKKAIKLQRDILKSTSMLHSLGYRIKTRYINGAGWSSEIVDRNTGENHELDEHSEPRPFPGMEGKGIDGGTYE